MSEVVAARRRRQSSASTRDSIRQAAVDLFGRKGFAATSVREIANAADVDPALVIRHFGSKEALFIETVPDHGPFDEAFDGPLAGFGERIVGHILDRVDRESTNVYLEVLRASGAEAVRHRLTEMMDASFLKLRDQLGGSDGALKTRLVAAQVTGLLVFLAGSRQTLSRADRKAIISIYGEAIQSVIRRREVGVKLDKKSR